MSLYLGKDKINNIKYKETINSDGIDTSDATVIANDILKDKTAYVNNNKIIGSMNNLTNTTIIGTGTLEYIPIGQMPKISISNTTSKSGFIDNTTTLQMTTMANSLGTAAAKDVLSGSTFSSISGIKLTGTIPKLTATTYSPSNEDQVITAGQYLVGDQTISKIKLEETTISPSNTSQVITPSSGYDGLSKITINAALRQAKIATFSTTENQYLTPDPGYYGLSQVMIPKLNLENKTVTPSNSQQIITADSGYDGLSQVIINAISRGTKVGTWSTKPNTTTRIRLTDTLGITNPYFAVIQHFSNTLYRNNLEEAIWCSESGLMLTRCIYGVTGGIEYENNGISVNMESGTILIEITSNYFTFDTNEYYTIFITESPI